MAAIPGSLELGMLIAGALLAVSVVASKASSKLGIPVLVLFLVVGMLAGSDGPGGIPFTDAHFARNLGTFALAFILFAGGLETDWRTLRPVFGPGIALATVGVVLTTGLVGLFAWKVLGLPLLLSMLLGSVVASTDASAVFGVLRGQGIRLRHRLGPLLEIESGSNDPMAVFLTIALTGIIMGSGGSLASLIPSLIVEMSVGAIVGLGLGFGAVWVINHVTLDYDGLYPVLTSALVLVVYAGAHEVHGNGFLSVYVAGVVLGSKGFIRKGSLTHFHDAIAWLMQVTMFLSLGLLVFPKKLGEVAWIGLALAAFLVFIARPIAVFIALIPFRRLERNDKAFVSWVGLRGAVPIVLATIPLTSEVPGATRLFHLVFFVVLVSVMLQGTTIGYVARLLGVEIPGKKPEGRTAPANLLEVALEPGASAIGKRVVDMNFPSTALLVLVTREERSFVPQGSTLFKEGDRIQLASRKQDLDDLRRMLLGK